ncbi:MAG: quinone-dependent dihydroorotate dehydrogenase [Flavobacteriales bacterium]|nr:quinone-dependent dihydroorotate dehydrogenase [Flavobacteriales bacterium]
MYKLIIRPILFLLSPEKIHTIIFRLIRFLFAFPGVSSIVSLVYRVDDKRLERDLFGLKFSNPIGLAAGFDKNAVLVDELSSMGFGFLEVGTVTPKPQDGNPKPRLFRLKEDNAIINRMGFNNDGVIEIANRLRKVNSKIIIGGNIGKNKVTLNEDAQNDYIKAYEGLYDVVDYFVLNVSSPNTPGLRELQEKEPLKALLNQVSEINRLKSKPKPILLKIAPDLTNEQLIDIIEIVEEVKLDGVIATNTTIDRSNLKAPDSMLSDIGNGGLSGKPLVQRSTEVIRFLHDNSKTKFPIIGVGGIHSKEDALEKLEAGASLIQLYTGFIYEGPVLVKEINEALLKSSEKK